MMILALWGVLMVHVMGQRAVPGSFDQSGLPEPPEFGIRDSSGVFSRNTEVTRRIVDKIRDLEVDHGFRIFLMVEPLLLDATAPELAVRLQQAWLPDGDGLVVVMESDTRNAGFGPASRVAGESGDHSGLVPSHEIAAILRGAVTSADKNLAPEAYAETLIGNLVDGFRKYFDSKSRPVPQARNIRFGLLMAGLVTILALGAIAVGSLTRLRSLAGVQTYHFPVVDRPERLGAPSGGGQVTSRRFKGSS